MASSPTTSISTSSRRRCDDGVSKFVATQDIKREPPMSAQASRAAAKPAIAKSGAAGSAIFPGSDSRKYNYFEPKGRKATHYEDMTVDVQPDPERYLLQDWIISFPRWNADLFQGLDGGEELQLAQIPRRRPGMGTHPLPASIDHLRHGAEHHRERSQVGRARSLRHGLGKDTAGPSRRLQARRIRPGHVDRCRRSAMATPRWSTTRS